MNEAWKGIRVLCTLRKARDDGKILYPEDLVHYFESNNYTGSSTSNLNELQSVVAYDKMEQPTEAVHVCKKCNLVTKMSDIYVKNQSNLKALGKFTDTCSQCRNRHNFESPYVLLPRCSRRDKCKSYTQASNKSGRDFWDKFASFQIKLYQIPQRCWEEQKKMHQMAAYPLFTKKPDLQSENSMEFYYPDLLYVPLTYFKL